MEELAKTFKALSEEIRLKILWLILAEGELCVCEIERILEISQSKASRHLRYMQNAGLLKDRRAGISVYYRISETLSPEQKALLKTLKKLLESEGYACKELLEKFERRKCEPQEGICA